MRRETCGAALACLILALLCSAAATPQKPPKASPPETNHHSGRALYKRFCAVCHGNDGKGNGLPPRSSGFKQPPPDLTTLARRHDGKFPDAYVKDVLQSGVSLSDHGSSEMPVWGAAFKAMKPEDEAAVDARIANLISYLKFIQAKD